MEKLKKKVVVVSGGSKGLGLAICQTLLSEGYCVATFSRKSTYELQQVINEYKDQIYWESVDVSNFSQLSQFLQTVKKRFGRVGYLINNAGVASEGLLTMMKKSNVTKVMQVNLEGTILLTQMCAKQMMVAGFGVIINISSVVGIRGYKGVTVYGATKAALDGLTRGLSKELGSMGIRVNSLAPGFMETDMTTVLTDKQKSRIKKNTPLGRMGTVEDVSSAVKFLFSDEASFITGHTLVVDGGITV
ncbi:MAG: SDR family oxidoreductase [Bacteroidales bacterium]|nr:SDR family oxidoreductase [Bacteroidales bacterium]